MTAPIRNINPLLCGAIPNREDYQSEERCRKSRATPPYGYADNSRAGAMQAPYAAPCRGK